MKLDFSSQLLMFTDGACSGNPGPGGYGTILVYPEGEVEELGEARQDTTNNRMEMLAIIKGFQALRKRPGDLWILTDSTYVIRGITQWIFGWKKKGWTTGEGAEVSNKDYWLLLDEEVRERKKMGTIEWKYLRGHAGHPGNERCDEIAVAFSKGKYISLYTGPLLKYPYAIHDLPEDLSLPPMKTEYEKKPPAHSYLSYVGGQLERHLTWAECEAKVKGRPGAKFKKSKSAEDEQAIIKGWGLNPDLLKGSRS
jgi:ribonuclease HI